MLSIDEFTRVADRITEEIPAKLVQELNGGILVLPDTKKDPSLPGIYILGEYIVKEPGMGRYIALYYGSFASLFKNKNPEHWEKEIRKTIRHELRHHIEFLAGIDDLGEEDRLEYERLHHKRKGRKKRREI